MVVDHIPADVGLPPKAKIVHKSGIVDTKNRDYKIIGRVQSINKTNDAYKRSRSSSRSRISSDNDDSNRGRTMEVIGGGKGGNNWTERGTRDSSVGGVLRRGRSSSRQRYQESLMNQARSISVGRYGEARDDGQKTGLFRGRSSSRQRGDGTRKRSESRGPFGFLRGRSSSRARKADAQNNRGRSTNRRDDGSMIEDKLLTNTGDLKLPPIAAPPKVEKDEVDSEIDKILAERELLSEVEGQESIPHKPPKKTSRGIDGLNDHDIMQLDEKNSIMHVALLLHQSSDEILERLETDPSLASSSNKANETPLHYAAMDKKGVNKDVLKRLLQLFPEAVKQPNVQNSLPIHLACMVGAPSNYVVKTLLKMYPKALMIQSDFPLMFDDDMIVKNNSGDDSDDESSQGSEFIAYKPKQLTAASGIASMFACAAPHQAAIEMANERNKRRAERNEGRIKASHNDGLLIETGFSPLHLAVMNSASPSVVGLLIKVNSRCLHLKTSKGRTALDCAQYIVKQHWLYGSDDENAIQNTFATIEVLEEAVNAAN